MGAKTGSRSTATIEATVKIPHPVAGHFAQDSSLAFDTHGNIPEEEVNLLVGKTSRLMGLEYTWWGHSQ